LEDFLIFKTNTWKMYNRPVQKNHVRNQQDNPFIALMMAALRTSGTSVDYNETTRRYITEGSKLHSRCS
jgi:hypothetical protein